MREFDKKREDIIETASRLFNLLGYENTSMRRIAIAMGSGKASLYYYFKSKEELFVSVVRHEGAKYFNEFEQDCAGEYDITKKIRHFLMIPLRLYEDKRSIAVKIFTKAVNIRIKRVQQLANELLQGFFMVFRELLHEGIETDVIKKDLDIDRFMTVMMNFISGLYFLEFPGFEILNHKEEKRKNYEFMIDTMIEGIKK